MIIFQIWTLIPTVIYYVIYGLLAFLVFQIHIFFIRITRLKIIKFEELFKNHPEAQGRIQLFESHENTVQKYIIVLQRLWLIPII